jgi:hypothetical protein
MLLARAAEHNLYIPAGDNTSAFFMPENGRSAAACPSTVHFFARKAASR